MKRTTKMIQKLLQVIYLDDCSDTMKYDLIEQLVLECATDLGYCEYKKDDDMYYLSKKGISAIDDALGKTKKE